MNPRLCFIALSVVMGAAACDPVVTVRASVRNVASCKATEYEKVPSVAGAEVVLRCPNAKDKVLGSTDASGQFALRYVGLMEEACSLTVQKAGYEPQTFALEDICVGHLSAKYCYGAVLTADLSPTGSSR